MKKCPICKMTVNADNECPFCGASLTYEPHCEADKEHIVWNKYYFKYLVKTIWFALICCLFGAVKIIVVRPPMSELLMTAILLALFSFFISCFQRSWMEKMKWKYQESYLLFLIPLWKYGFGLLSVIFFLFIK